ncbi:MAG: hypothetical protein Q7S40_03740, partial [Opitutaceae bacterium]|nr:hypothetical protein [Opitutaceae bacterium]
SRGDEAGKFSMVSLGQSSPPPLEFASIRVHSRLNWIVPAQEGWPTFPPKAWRRWKTGVCSSGVAAAAENLPIPSLVTSAATPSGRLSV